MFEYIRKHTRVLFFVLIVLIIPSFVFFGLEGYTGMRDGGNQTVVEVAGIKITQAEWDNAHLQQVERARRQSPELDAKAFDTPELKNETLEALIRERLMVVASNKLNLITSDERMARLFRQDPQFEFLRNPDGTVNRDLLQAQGMSSELFAQRLRQDISSRQVMQGVEGTTLALGAVATTALDAFFQQREVQVQRFDAARYAEQLQPTEADIEAFYKDTANAARFQAPEQADIEYLVLDAAALEEEVRITDEELQKYYTENASRYTAPEERRASHILITVDAGANAEVRAQARARAEALLAEVRKAPASFAEIARKNSQDPGSAANGGDLDFFPRGAMVKPFEDAAFALAPNAISEVVTSDFGFHIIQLTGVRGGEKKPFEAVRTEIQTLLTKQLAQQKYSEMAAEFSNLVYEQADTLQPAAERFKLELRTAKALQRVPAPGASGPLASPKLLDAVFGNDAIANKRNTDAIETAPSQMVSARVVQHQPARLRPLAEVREQVLIQVRSRQAAELARKAGEVRLTMLKAEPSASMDEAVVAVSRVNPANLPKQVVDAVMRQPASTLPALFGVDLGSEGYAVVKLTKVVGRDPAAPDPASLRGQFAQAIADAESQAYYEALKRRFKVDRSGADAVAAKAAVAERN